MLSFSIFQMQIAANRQRLVLLQDAVRHLPAPDVSTSNHLEQRRILHTNIADVEVSLAKFQEQFEAQVEVEEKALALIS